MASMKFSPTKKGVKTFVSPQSDAFQSTQPISPDPWFPLAKSPVDETMTDPRSSSEEEVRKKPEVLDNNIPTNNTRTIEIINPEFFQPRFVQDTLAAPVFLPKWQMYCNMEIFWPRLQKNIEYLKNSVASRPFVLKPFEPQDDEKDNDLSSENVGYGDAMQKYALVKQALENLRGSVMYNRNGFQDIIKDICDARGKGLSVQQIFWEQKGDVILPLNTQYVNAYYYKYDIVNNAITDMSGAPMDENRFLVAVYKNRGTLNLTALGIYQTLAYMWNAQFWVRRFWIQSVEKYGQPYRVVEYPQGSSAALKSALATAMANFAASGYGVLPAGSNFQLVESAINSGNANAHQLFIEECDKACDIVCLGQSLTTEQGNKGGSYSLGQVHERKENTIIDDLADYACGVLNEQFIPAILDVNGYDLENKPEFYVNRDVDMDMINKKIGLIQQLKGMGYKVNIDSLEEELEQLGIVIEGEVEMVQEPGLDNKPKLSPFKKDKETE